MKKYLCFCSVLFHFACNTNSEKKEPAAVTDTIGVTNKIIENTFDEKLFKELQLPLTIDTTFIIKLDTNSRIPYQHLRQMGASFLNTELSAGLPYDLNMFCQIDSLKEEGKYKEYVEKLDIGMTKKSIAFKIGYVDLKNGAKLFLWGIDHSSYEACPFFAGTTVVGTFVNDNRKNTHFVLGCVAGGGDAPMGFHEEMDARIMADGKIDIKKISVTDDRDIPGEETTKEYLVLKLETDKITIVDSKKEVKTTEKAPEAN